MTGNVWRGFIVGAVFCIPFLTVSASSDEKEVQAEAEESATESEAEEDQGETTRNESQGRLSQRERIEAVHNAEMRRLEARKQMGKDRERDDIVEEAEEMMADARERYEALLAQLQPEEEAAEPEEDTAEDEGAEAKPDAADPEE